MANLIRHLPRNSAYWHAVTQDEELAEQWLQRERSGEDLGDEDPSIPLTEWSPERESLARVEDLLQQVVAVTTAAGGTKPRPFKPSPRPRTALAEARERQRIEMNHHFMDLLVPEGREN